MEITRSITVRAPVDTVWDRLANDFYEVASWAASVDASRKLSAIGPAGQADRQCDVPGFGTITESLHVFDETRKTFAYDVIEGRPGMVTALGNTWTIEPVDAQRTSISFRIQVEVKPLPKALMGWMMKRNMEKLADSICEDLSVYLETGKPRAAAA